MQIAQKNFYKKLLGRVGEKKACAFLKDNGYKILETNYRTPFGEIDIIVEIDKITVFVEVKTRSNENYGFPCEAESRRARSAFSSSSRCTLKASSARVLRLIRSSRLT